MFLIDTQTDKVFPLPLWFLPVVPNTVPETVSYPAIHVLQFTRDTCYSVVPKPTPVEFFQFMDALVERCRSGFPGDGFDFQL